MTDQKNDLPGEGFNADSYRDCSPPLPECTYRSAKKSKERRACPEIRNKSGRAASIEDSTEYQHLTIN